MLRCGNKIPVNIDLVEAIHCEQIQAREIIPYVEPSCCNIYFQLSSCNDIVWRFENKESVLRAYHAIMGGGSKDIQYET